MGRIWNRIVAVLATIPQDKLLHLIAGMLITALVACVKAVAPLALFSGLIAGICKEWWDSRHGGSVEYADIVATWLGAVVMQIFVLLYLFIW